MSGGVSNHSALGTVRSDYVELSTIAPKEYYKLSEETINIKTKRGHFQGMRNWVSKWVEKGGKNQTDKNKNRTTPYPCCFVNHTEE
jgi:hypothetical protein